MNIVELAISFAAKTSIGADDKLIEIAAANDLLFLRLQGWLLIGRAVKNRHRHRDTVGVHQ